MDKIKERLEVYLQNNKEDKFVIEYLKNNLIPILDIEDFEIFWLNRNKIDINLVYDEVLNDSKESFQSILKKKTNIKNIDYIFNDTYNEIFDEISPEKLIKLKKIKQNKL